MSRSNESSAILLQESCQICTHPSSPFPEGRTDLGSAQSSLVVPFWLTHNVEMEVYKQSCQLSETCPLCLWYNTVLSKLLFSSPPFILLSVNPSKNKRRAGAADEEKEKNTSPLQLEGWSTYSSPLHTLSLHCNDFCSIREHCNWISQSHDEFPSGFP